MKTFATIFALLGFVSQAQADYISCSSGTGDEYYEINFYEDGIEFLPYESSFTLDAADIGYDNGTYTIVNKSTEKSCEGQTSTIIVNAMLLLNAAGTDLNAAISTDHGPFQSHTMTCVEK